MNTDIRYIDGTSQNNRGLPSFENGFYKIDEFTFEELILFCIEYSKNLNYFNRNNRISGNWENFLIGDELIVCAMIMSLDITGTENKFLDVYKLKLYGQDNYLKLADCINELALKIDQWYKCLHTLNQNRDKKLINMLASIIKGKLAIKLSYVKEVVSLLEKENPGIDYNGYQSIWFMFDPSVKGKIKFEGNYDPIIIQNLHNIFYSFRNAIAHLQKYCRNLFEQYQRDQIHPPHISLLLAFLKLYETAKKETNKLEKKYFQLYYFDVLKNINKNAVPDKVPIIFEPDENASDIFIPRGTELVAEYDGSTLLYSTDKELVVNKAKIKKIFTLYVERDPLISPEAELNLATKIVYKELPASVFGYPAVEPLLSYPVFGKPDAKKTVADYETFDPGFIITSPVLEVAEGNRDIDICFKFGSESFENFKMNCTAIAEKLSLDTEETESEIINSILNDAFEIWITNENGWGEIKNYLIKSDLQSDEGDCAITVSFTLDYDDASITDYSEEIHCIGIETNEPAIKFIVNNDSYIYLYDLVKKLIVQEININVKVEDLHSLKLYSSEGPLDPSNPFFPFGSVPTLSSSFIFGAAELINKQLTKLDLNIEWSELPRDKKGFTEYYSGYNNFYDNNIFRTKFSTLLNGKWLPVKSEDRQEFSLFSGDDLLFGNIIEPGILKNSSTFKNLNLKYFRPLDYDVHEEDYQFNFKTRSGFFKLEIAGPEYLFGHKEYPEAVSRITLHNARYKKNNPMPNAPYAPVVKRVSLNYSANARITTEYENPKAAKKSNGSFYHFSPFGNIKLLPAEKNNQINFLPDIENDGNLLLGILNVKNNDVINFYFKIEERASENGINELPTVNWSFLEKNRWKKIAKENILFDSTNGFLNSGIVSMQLCGEICTRSSIMPQGFWWLKASAQRTCDCAGDLIFTGTQAMHATWERTSDETKHLYDGLPEKTITQARFPLTGIKSIIQVSNSIGGRNTELEKHIRVRVSERLRHKQRAVTLWDYERIVLQEFPEIQKVKCFPNMNSKKLVAPGCVLIVVIPKLPAVVNPETEPRANNLLLFNIKSYLEKLISSNCKIEVRNPDYDRLQVRCNVKFSEGISGGYGIKKLNEDLINYLSPWAGAGKEPEFCKPVRIADVVGFIQNLDYLDYITKFSMLQIASDGKEFYCLYDTQKGNLGATDLLPSDKRIIEEFNPSRPWNIMNSSKKHFINALNIEEEILPVQTGIGDMEMGRTFIIE